MRALSLAVLVIAVSACPAASKPDAGGGVGGGGGSAIGGGGGSASGGGSATDAGIAGVELLALLPGLWSGPATMTPLGNFPRMAFDLRPVDGQMVFGQAELDSADTLRFGFNIETYQGRDVLAYRNGGYFGGVLRDTRTALDSSDGGTWRFCYVGDGGCDYIDARFTVSGSSLVLDTHVRGQPHVYWNAQREETRMVAPGFPTDLASRGDGSAPWPALTTVQVNASWATANAGPADLWLILTTTNCFPTFGCHPSRSISGALDAGTTAATLSLPNVHPGSYKATLLLDRDRNFTSTFAPSSGDTLAVDQPLEVPDGGTATLNATLSYTVP